MTHYTVTTTGPEHGPYGHEALVFHHRRSRAASIGSHDVTEFYKDDPELPRPPFSDADVRRVAEKHAGLLMSCAHVRGWVKNTIIAAIEELQQCGSSSESGAKSSVTPGPTQPSTTCGSTTRDSGSPSNQRNSASGAASENDGSDEKRRRIYYQDIVYSVCNAIDKLNGRRAGGGIVCGTVDTPTTQVQDAMRSLVKRLSIPIPTHEVVAGGSKCEPSGGVSSAASTATDPATSSDTSPAHESPPSSPGASGAGGDCGWLQGGRDGSGERGGGLCAGASAPAVASDAGSLDARPHGSADAGGAVAASDPVRWIGAEEFVATNFLFWMSWGAAIRDRDTFLADWLESMGEKTAANLLRI